MLWHRKVGYLVLRLHNWSPACLAISPSEHEGIAASYLIMHAPERVNYMHDLSGCAQIFPTNTTSLGWRYPSADLSALISISLSFARHHIDVSRER
jgi:hypothetical protein